MSGGGAAGTGGVIAVVGTGGPGGGGAGDGGGASHQVRPAQALGTWVGTPIGQCGANGETWVAGGAIGGAGASTPPPDFVAVGVVELYQLIAPNGDTLATLTRNSCNGDPVPQPPPSADDILSANADLLPDGSVVTSPHVTGLVGLENRFWHEGPTTQPVTASLNGWVGTTTAVATRFCWDFGDGASACADVPGSEDDPVATHVYTTQGTYQLTETITWEASFTLTGPAGIVVATGLGTFDDTGPARAYDVEEREAVVVG